MRFLRKTVFSMTRIPFLVVSYVLLIAGAILFSHCKQGNATEVVENPNPDGSRERYERRKSDFAKQGLYQRFRVDGKLAEEAHFVADTLEGERRYYYPNGTLESKEYYKKGVIDGKFQGFYENGSLQIEKVFVNGSLNGELKTFYPDGVVKEKVMLKNNEEDGPFTEYYPNGKIKAEGLYKPTEDGSVEHGELKEYDENGELVRIADCVDGACSTKWKK
jgi:antitoxin component YwqK of YwqJK toxin-antitoxin module